MSEEKLLTNISSFPFKSYSKGPGVRPHPPSLLDSVWHRVPSTRRAAVFILLFIGQLGELRVVLTKRSSKLRTFPGHVSLPGGKADDAQETEWQVSRREMHEEIGLHSSNSVLLERYGFEVQHLNVMPSYLSRTFSAVRPCVGFMPSGSALELALNPGESSSMFSCPLRDFLYPVNKELNYESIKRVHQKTNWGGIPWQLRSFTFPQHNDQEAHWLKVAHLSESDEDADLSDWGPRGSRRDSTSNERIYDVWGLTANILHDLAEVVYAGGSSRELGEEELIFSLWKSGEMKRRKRSDIESRLIENSTGFDEVLGPDEVKRLGSLYRL